MTEQQVIKAIKERTFFVSFTQGDNSKRIGSYKTHGDALLAVERLRLRYQVRKCAGLLSVYCISAKRGFIGQELYEVLEV